MNLLLVAATEAEITPFLAHLRQNWTNTTTFSFTKGDNQLTICITGVGMMATTYSLTKALQQPYDFALQAGVGGSFDTKLSLGEVVFITSEQYGDLGAEDHYNFLDIFNLGLLDPNTPPFINKELLTSPHPLHDKINLPKAKGLTINTVSGSTFTIQTRIEKFAPQIESMEGAPFHYVCLHENIPFAQIRSLSNYVEPRDKSKWQMKDAIINLNKWLIDFIEHL